MKHPNALPTRTIIREYNFMRCRNAIRQVAISCNAITSRVLGVEQNVAVVNRRYHQLIGKCLINAR